MKDIATIQKKILDIYNNITEMPIESVSMNLFEPEFYSSPTDMIYFVGEIEKYYNIIFNDNDIVYEKFCTLERIAKVIQEKCFE